MIYTFNARGFRLYPVMKTCLELSDENVYRVIQGGFQILQERLALKGISYDNLKGALIPNQDKDKFETCLIIDSNKIESSDYGYYVFERFIPYLDQQSTYSILCGDYIDTTDEKCPDSQRLLYVAMDEVLERYHEFQYSHSSQYFLIYINRLSRMQRQKILDGLGQYEWFTGFADLTHHSMFKNYISTILVNVCIKNGNQVIMPHASDCSDEENINMRRFPFESNGFRLSSINEESYGAFLSYKIESQVPDIEDVSFSFNALFPRFDSFQKIKLNISDEKWRKYLTDPERGKGRIIESLGYTSDDKEGFTKEIFRQICANYIYNLRENEYGDLMFNVCIELPTVHDNLRKTTVALKYHPESGAAEVLTLT